MRCRHCGTWLVDHVTHVEDTPDGLLLVVDEPVAPYVITCRCSGFSALVTGRQASQIHPGQMRLLEAAT